MKVNLTEAERQQLRQLQKQRRDDEGYGKGTVLLLLDRGPSAGRMAEALSLDEGTVYRYARAWQRLDLERDLAHERSGYWGRLPSAALAGLCRELEQTLYTNCRAIQAWVEQRCGVRYSISGLTDRLHRLGFCYQRTTPLPCAADAARQAALLTEQLPPLLAAAAAG
jgi:transposase